MRLAGRHRRRPEGRPRQGVAGQAVRLGGGLPLRRPGRPGLRRPRLHARVRRRAVLPRAPGRPDLGGHLARSSGWSSPGPSRSAASAGSSADDRRRPPADAGRPRTRAGAASGRSTSGRCSPRARSRSSARRPGPDLAETVRDNLHGDGQRDALPLRQPEVRRKPGASRATRTSPRCPRCPTPSLVALNPLRAATVTQAGGRRGCAGASSSRAAAWSRAARPRPQMQRDVRDDRPPRTAWRSSARTAWAMIDLTTNAAVVHRRRQPVAAARRRGRDRPERLGHRRVHPLRDADRVQPDHRQRRRGRPRRVRLPGALASTTPRPTRSSCSWRASSDPSGSSRWPTGRSSSASRSSPSRSGGQRAGAGGGDRPQRVDRRRGPGDRRRARRRRGHPLRRSRRAARGRRARTPAAGGPGRSVGRGRTGVVTVSTGEASLIADLAAETGLDLPPVPDAARAAILRDLPTMGYVGNPIDPWGAADDAIAIRSVFARLRRVGCLRRPRDRPRLPVPLAAGRGRGRADGHDARSLDATRDRPEILPVFISLTSGEPTPEIQALLDAAGGVPLLRGPREAERAIARRAWWEARRAERRLGRARPPDLAGAGGRPDARAVTTTDPSGRGRDAAASTDAVRGRAPRAAAGRRRPGRRGDRRRPTPATARAAAAGWAAGRSRSSSTPSVWPTRAISAAFALGLAGDQRSNGGRSELLELRPAARPRRPRRARRADGRRRDRAHRRARPRPAVRTGRRRRARRGPRRGPRRRGDPARADRPSRGARDARVAPRGPLLAGARGRPAVDRRAVADLVVALGRLAWDRPDLVAVDLNPVLAGPDGAIAVDALVVLEDASTG